MSWIRPILWLKSSSSTTSNSPDPLGYSLEKSQLKDQFQEKLNLFCFFHLGSDAQLEVLEEADQLRVRLEQHRITPLTFTLTYQRLEEMLADSAELENFMLDQIISHRR